MAAKKWFSRGDMLAPKCRNIGKINKALEDLIKYDCIEVTEIKGRDGVIEKYYTQTKLDEAADFLHSNILDSNIHHYIIDRVQEVGLGVTYSMIIYKFGDATKNARKKLFRDLNQSEEQDMSIESNLIGFSVKVRGCATPIPFFQRMYSPLHEICAQA